MSAIPYRGGGNDTGDAILHAINKLKNGKNARKGVQKIIIVMTDGYSNLTLVQNAVAEMHK